jgi:ubiquinone/menaquinone biosynthesis C-methylase UbiE
MIKMEQTKDVDISKLCPPEACDTFQFMAKDMGLSVLHPGGLDATRKLAELSGIENGLKIIDLGCGRGSGSIFLARSYGCHVVGVDIDEDLLSDARETAKKKNLDEFTEFRYADIENLPFENDSFDGAISQAVLVFTDKDRALKEVNRVVKPGGFMGAIELTWKQTPTEDIVKRVQDTLCSVSIQAELHQGWRNRFEKAGLTVVHKELNILHFTMRDMLRDEGILRGLACAIKGFVKSSSRERLARFTRLFEETEKYLGYGIYIGRVT